MKLEDSASAPQRPARFVVLAVGHFVFAVVALIWALANVGALVLVGGADSSAAGVATVSTVAVINLVLVVLLVTGGIGLLRSSRWGWYATIAYGVLSVGHAVILYSTGASLVLVAALLVYPVTALILVNAPVARRAAGVR